MLPDVAKRGFCEVVRDNSLHFGTAVNDSWTIALLPSALRFFQGCSKHWKRDLVFRSPGGRLELDQLLETHDLDLELVAKAHRIGEWLEIFVRLFADLAQNIELPQCGREQHMTTPEQV